MNVKPQSSAMRTLRNASFRSTGRNSCPSDDAPKEEHSYIINDHLWERGIKWTGKNLGHWTSSHIVLMGEKKSDAPDYYMETGEDFNALVERFRHGKQRGSNCLFMDWHVEVTRVEEQVLTAGALLGIDPWDPWDPLVP